MRKANEAISVNEALSINGDVSAKKVWSKRTAKIFSWGIISLIMFLIIFLNQNAVTKYFTEGGAFVVAIVATALAFAFVHGNFANYVLEGLNFKAVNRKKDGH